MILKICNSLIDQVSQLLSFGLKIPGHLIFLTIQQEEQYQTEMVIKCYLLYLQSKCLQWCHHLSHLCQHHKITGHNHSLLQINGLQLIQLTNGLLHHLLHQFNQQLSNHHLLIINGILFSPKINGNLWLLLKHKTKLNNHGGLSNSHSPSSQWINRWTNLWINRWTNLWISSLWTNLWISSLWINLWWTSLWTISPHGIVNHKLLCRHSQWWINVGEDKSRIKMAHVRLVRNIRNHLQGMMDLEQKLLNVILKNVTYRIDTSLTLMELVNNVHMDGIYQAVESTVSILKTKSRI